MRAGWAFQHTAARRRLPLEVQKRRLGLEVSTHSRPKAAAGAVVPGVNLFGVSTHSRPKAAASAPMSPRERTKCFNTQPPEGGCGVMIVVVIIGLVSTHSRPKAAARLQCGRGAIARFQHTAARRRLRWGRSAGASGCRFQHTAARRRLPKKSVTKSQSALFQHTAARRRLPDL